MKRVFISDCEGPISKNDYAFEITSHFVQEGDRLFTVISRYDDVLADVLKRPNYKAGDTLRLILPFLRAYDVTDEKMREFSVQNLVLISNVRYMLQYLRSIAHVFIVSTSYEHYIKALCRAISFPFENTYYTKLSIDRYQLAAKEKAKLKKMAKEIAQTLTIDIPLRAKSLKDLSEKSRETVQRLDEIFWEEIACTDCGRIFSEVKPVGGSEKADALKDAVKKVDAALAETMYIGDSITDVEAFRLARKNDGLTVSFNGNQYAIKNAEIAVLSESSLPTTIIADVFCRFGKQQALSLAENWSRKTLKKSPASPSVLERFFALNHLEMPKVKIITKQNTEILAKESSEFRKKVRGEAIGRLG